MRLQPPKKQEPVKFSKRFKEANEVKTKDDDKEVMSKLQE